MLRKSWNFTPHLSLSQHWRQVQICQSCGTYAWHSEQSDTVYTDSLLCHSAAHPGNLLRTADGKLGYLDFGMMASIDPKIRQ